jgi:hypothetical protein
MVQKAIKRDAADELSVYQSDDFKRVLSELNESLNERSCVMTENRAFQKIFTKIPENYQSHLLA